MGMKHLKCNCHKKLEHLPFETATRTVTDNYKKAVKTNGHKNPGKAKFSESLNNYNAVRDKVENDMQGVRSSINGPPVKKRVRIGLS